MNRSRIKSCGGRIFLKKFLKPIPTPENNISFKELWETEWSTDFEELCRHRLVAGALRYGRLNSPGKKQWNRPIDIKDRIDIDFVHLLKKAHVTSNMTGE